MLTSPAGNVTGIAVTGLADGATDMNFNWNLYDKNNSPLLTQVASASTTSTTFQDGYASGTLLNFNVGSDGVIAGTFTNGKTSPIAQITLARFPNQQGLLRQGSNNYISSLASGDPGHRHAWRWRPRHGDRRRPRAEQRRHRHRVLEDDRRPAGLPGQRQSGDHFRRNHAGHDQPAALVGSLKLSL